ncbi:hypothetical protein [Streptomyces sp. WMMC897]|uniref:hypothetical protein n=1 Tax=Streptomyces sp. WMMC897 TaxID=3014782 RepID=UPI0022B6586D|nr:hypothetical protein [Streptomyces sp. WMMC897]MCZ7415923.1 hypothetical protein [Streptomyces sp. WMMC897]
MTGSRLAPGAEVVAVPDGGLALRTPDGDFLRVSTGKAEPLRLLARLSGRGHDAAPSTEGPVQGDADSDDADPGDADPHLGRLLGAFADAGYLADAPGLPDAATAEPSRPAGLGAVWLLGAPALTVPLAVCLAAAGARPRTVEPPDLGPLTAAPAPGTADRSAADRPVAVVWCLDEPVPPGLWDAADTLPAHGIAWLRCHREGYQLWVEPLAAGPADVTSSHLRARRLAATPAHRELAAYWAGHRTTGAPVTLTPAAATLAAALLAADLTAWATGAPSAPGTLPVTRRLRRVDLRDLTVTPHAVLPVPPVAPPLRATP